MNRIEFMNRLEQLLWSLPPDERADALKYYNDYFDDAGSQREQEVIRELISPEHVAKTILGDMYQDTQSGWKQNSSHTDYQNGWNVQPMQQPLGKKIPTWAWVLLIVTLPITIPIGISAISVLISIFAGISALFLGFLVGGIALFVAAILLFVAGFGGFGCLCLGIGSLMECIAFLMIPLIIWFFRTAIPQLYRFVKKQIKKINGRGGTLA